MLLPILLREAELFKLAVLIDCEELLPYILDEKFFSLPTAL